MRFPPRKQGHPRVLVVRLSAVGDCLQTMPLVCAVRDGWPESHITWVVEKGAAPLVAANDAVDRLIVLPKGFANSLGTLALSCAVSWLASDSISRSIRRD